ncbi:hypothetical protein M2277_004925 [Paenibacillus sp. LBL]|uniref:hypothetical protein n=1 Tax=Paenibacillus sp. LBL TaxID=2940563 RepID=UPI002473825C|nr:hypothetical protein [Paenibacillus sp. LBL]MDH6674233.1 hypothetical protein [Paenibacillus sp. LBL]
MATPTVTWWNGDNTAAVTDWAIGTVDAGTVSQATTFTIWNNRAGTTAVADMDNCTITTKDASGGNTGELVINKWIEVKVETMGETTFSAIGGSVTKAIKAGGTTVPAGTISGKINDGTIAGGVDNFAKVTLQANVPATATAGNVDFLTRVAYTYN